MKFEEILCYFGVAIIIVVTLIGIGIVFNDLIKTIKKWIRKI